jgi:preprotein translocase subunit SecF
MKFVVSLVAIALVGTVLFVVVLELFISGGADNSQDQSKGSQAEQSKQERTDGEKAKKEAEKLEWVAGIVLKSASDKHAVIVKPDNGERQLFTYKPDKVEVTLDGKEAGLDAIDEGQRVSIGYETVTTNKDREVNVAQSINLESKNGSPEDESTG